MFHDYFTITGTGESISDLSDTVRHRPRIQHEVGRSSSITSVIPAEGVLDSVYKTRVRDSEQMKSTMASETQDTLQKREQPSYTRLTERYATQIRGSEN